MADGGLVVAPALLLPRLPLVTWDDEQRERAAARIVVIAPDAGERQG